MPQDISKHSFEGGMNKDLSKSKIQPNQYTDAKNITVSLNEENNLISLTNIKGNTKQWGLPYLDTASGPDRLFVYDRSNDDTLQEFAFADIEVTKAQVDANGLDYRIVGYTTIRNTLILLTRPKTDVNGLSMIWTVDLDSLSTNPVLKYVGLLNFPLSPIDVEGNYESSTIQKIYWADGTNELGHFNIADSEGYKLNADKLSKLPNVDLPVIDIQNIIDGGNLPYGIIQYAVHYYNLNSSESSISEFSEKTYLFKENADSSIDIADTTVNINKSIVLNISNIDTNWEYIKVYRIHYATSTEDPTITVIRDSFNSSSTLNITDDGTIELATSTLSELTRKRLSTKTIPTSIQIKDNRLLIGNYQEDLYNPTYDTRAYRFYSSDNGSYTTDVEVENISGTPVSYTDYTNVPITDDAINPDNDLQEFPIDGSVRAFRKGFAASTNTIYERGNINEATSGIGGSGENVSYYFVYKDRPIDNDTTSAINISIDPEQDDSPENLLNMGQASFMRDEIYRFAVILIDNKGRRSLPRWIGDIRIPSAKDLAPTYVNSNILYAREIYPTFVFSNVPSDCTAFEIVYVPREEEDKTVLAQGLILPTREFTGAGDSADTYKCLGIPELVTGTSPSTDADNKATPYWYNDSLSIAATLSAVDADTYSREYCGFHSLDLHFKKNIQLPNGIYFSNEYIQGYGVITSTSSETFYREVGNASYLTSAKQDSVIPYSNTTDRIQTPDEYKFLNDESNIKLNSETFKYIAGWSNKGSGDDVAGVPYSTLIFKKASLARYKAPSYDNATYGTNHLIGITNLKAPLLNQYNGQGYSARLTNEYTQGSQVSTSTTVYADRGDTYILADILILSRATAPLYNQYVNSSYIGGFESQIKRRHITTKSLERQTFVSILSAGDLTDFDGDLTGGTGTNYYQVNNLTNRLNLNIYYPDISNKTDIVNGTYINSFKISEVKFNNETTDSWLQFLANNYLDVDGKYGPINSINEVNDTIIFFQDDAVGQLSINPKYASATNEGSLIVGTGGILDDYKYITTTHGCKNRESILRTPKGLYYFDIQNKKLRMLGDEQSPLSDIKGLHSYLKDNVSNVGNNPIQANGITAGYDYSTNKAYFTFHTNNPFTISYDESLNIIESFIDCNPLLWISTRQGIYSTMSEADYDTSLKTDDFYQFGTGQYGRFFATLYPSYITFIENKNPDVVKILNNIEYFNEVTSSGVEDTTNTFDYLQVWNNYQDTTELPLIYPNRIHIYDRKWRLPIPRNYKPYTPTILESTGNTLSSGVYVLHPTTFYLYKTLQAITSYDLPSNNSLDQDKFLRVKTRLDRIRDFFSFIKLKFTNDGADKLIAHDILVKYDY